MTYRKIFNTFTFFLSLKMLISVKTHSKYLLYHKIITVANGIRLSISIRIQ